MSQDAGESGYTVFTKQWKQKLNRCTIAQKKALVEYMSTHRQLARHQCDPATADVEWKRLVETLNSDGTVKTMEAWKHTWRDLRRKASRDQAEARATNCSMSEISTKIREIMAGSDEETTEKPNDTHASPTQSITIHSEESDQDYETSETLIQTMEVPDEGRASPTSELESIHDVRDSSTDNSPATSPTPSNKRRCTQDQINTLVDCMAINTPMAFGKQTTPKKTGDWRRLRQFLNKMGPAKRTLAWQKTWRDLKRSAVITGQTKPHWIKPTTKKILDIIQAYNPNLNDLNELWDDDSEMFWPSETVRAPSKSPLSEYLILPEGDRSRTRDSGKRSSPGRRGSTTMPLVDYSYRRYDDERDSDAECERPQPGKKQRCTNAQKYALVEYMAQHPDVATARASDADYYYKWRQLTKYLNQVGTAKTTVSWKRTWRELKKNARLNRAPNHKWSSINNKIRKICDNASFARPTKSGNETVEELNESTDDMPLGYTKRQSERATTHEVIVCEEDTNQEPNSPCDRSGGVSPDQCDSMSPEQHSEQTPSKITKEKTPASKLKNGRCTPSQINALLDYMAKHPSLAQAKCLYSSKGKDPWATEWGQLTEHLNDLNKTGPARSTTAWKVTWRSLCLNARRKKSVQCPSYEKVYKKVLKILSQPVAKEEVPVTKLETKEDCDSPPHSPEHPTTPPDPLNCEQAKHPTRQARSGQMSPGRRNSKTLSQIQRGSRMSPVRISDKVSAGRRSSDMSPGCSSDLERLNQSAMDGDTSLGRVKREMNSSRDPLDGKPKKMRCSHAQLRALQEYMWRHAAPAGAGWLRLARRLNDIGPARKPTEAWKRTWRDIKNRRRARGHGAGDHMKEDYVVTEPEVILTRRGTFQYNLAEIFARRSPNRHESERARATVERERESTGAPPNRLLQILLREVRRSNDLNVEQNEYLKEILKELRSQDRESPTRDEDRDSPTEHTSTHEQKQEVVDNSLEISLHEEISADYDEFDDADIKVPVSSPSDIRPVALTSLTSTTKPACERVKVQSILQGKVKPATPKGKLVRLKDGTMVLVPEHMKMQVESNSDQNGEDQIIDQKMEEDEDSWHLSNTSINEC